MVNASLLTSVNDLSQRYRLLRACLELAQQGIALASASDILIGADLELSASECGTMLSQLRIPTKAKHGQQLRVLDQAQLQSRLDALLEEMQTVEAAAAEGSGQHEVLEKRLRYFETRLQNVVGMESRIEEIKKELAQMGINRSWSYSGLELTLSRLEDQLVRARQIAARNDELKAALKEIGPIEAIEHRIAELGPLVADYERKASEMRQAEALLDAKERGLIQRQQRVKHRTALVDRLDALFRQFGEDQVTALLSRPKKWRGLFKGFRKVKEDAP